MNPTQDPFTITGQMLMGRPKIIQIDPRYFKGWQVDNGDTCIPMGK